MSGNVSLNNAAKAKQDEFYTRYEDIEAEMNAYIEHDANAFRGKAVLCPCDDPEWSNFTRYFAANFERFGIRKLVSTSYAKGLANYKTTEIERKSPIYDEAKHKSRGKVFTLEHDTDKSGRVDTDDITLTGYLDGDGDFRSKEVTALRDEADIIVTNPPFSLFHEFITWVVDGKKDFIIVGNMNDIKYKEVFPLLKGNKIWLGSTYPKVFRVPDGTTGTSTFAGKDGKTYQKFGNTCWFSNMDLAQRHKPLGLETKAHNLKYNKKLRKKLKDKYGTDDYPYYANFNALEVPLAECIPSDYAGVMGVPITFMSKYDPDQFDLIGMTGDLQWALNECPFFMPPPEKIQRLCHERNKTWRVQKAYTADNNGLPLISIYDRLFIKPKKG